MSTQSWKPQQWKNKKNAPRTQEAAEIPCTQLQWSIFPKLQEILLDIKLPTMRYKDLLVLINLAVLLQSLALAASFKPQMNQEIIPSIGHAVPFS